MGEIQDNFDYLLSSVYLDRAFSPQAKVLGDEMVDNILKTLASRFDVLDWMSNSTKVVAKQKCTKTIFLDRKF